MDLIALLAIGFVAMSYEQIEWGCAAYGGNAQAGANFLDRQGDVRDAQNDMFMDTLGAITAVLLFLVRDAASRPFRGPWRQMVAWDEIGSSNRRTIPLVA